MGRMTCKVFAVSILISGFAVLCTQAANDQDDLQAATDVIRQQKRIYIEKIMELDTREGEAFWALYDEYESGLSKLRNKRIELAANFLQSRGSLSDAEALAMLNQKLGLDAADLEFKQAYVEKFMQVLPGRKVLRFHQAENKFDTAAAAELYKNIPVVR